MLITFALAEVLELDAVIVCKTPVNVGCFSFLAAAAASFLPVREDADTW